VIAGSVAPPEFVPPEFVLPVDEDELDAPRLPAADEMPAESVSVARSSPQAGEPSMSDRMVASITGVTRGGI
jgi:hypothetical protein